VPLAESPTRVAIVGGGCAAIAAAFELTRPELGRRFEVTVYQQGWRLGGKGASGRGQHGRIEEHGLHVWMGCYENAFRLMREAYAELGRDPSTCSIASVRDAFMPTPHIGLAHWEPRTKDWSVWTAMFPPLPGEPGMPLGDPASASADHPFSIPGYLVRIARVMLSLFRTAYGEPIATGLPKGPALLDLAGELARTYLGGVASIRTLAGQQILTATELLRTWPHPRQGLNTQKGPLGPQELNGAPGTTAVLTGLLLALVRTLNRIELATAVEPVPERAAEVLEIIVVALVGVLRDGVLLDPRGLDALDDHDFIDWLRGHGLSRGAANSSFVRGLYGLMFAYEGGERTRPRAAAGQCLRGCLRMFFTYRGSFFWKMRSGMGDIVFAPLYEVLRRRGVKFEFFHRLVEVGLSDSERPHVDTLTFRVQAETNSGGDYEPLVRIRGVPCWPAEPDWSQLRDGEALRRRGVDFENFWHSDHVSVRKLRVGREFDFVVLGVSLGEIPHVCGQILVRDPRWRAMVENVRTVATQALQLWTTPSLEGLGWTRGPVTLTSFVHPFDTWADMSHLLDQEDWSSGVPGSIAYFCNVIADRDLEPLGVPDRSFRVRATELVRRNALTFVERDLAVLWPRLRRSDGEFAIEALQPEGAKDGSSSWLDQQFCSANVSPTDRYVQCVPGSPAHRISPLDRTYDNLTIAGDWTSCGLNLGCVEAAVMSGLLAAHAVSGSPRLESIVGYDHI